jgi:hypothetical protein
VHDKPELFSLIYVPGYFSIHFNLRFFFIFK